MRKRRRFTPLVVSAALGMAASGANSQPSEPGIDAFSVLFATTCMQHYYARDALQATVATLGGQEVPVENASFFLAGTGGSAWILMTEEGRFVVSLREDGTCAVFAQHADPDITKAAFVPLVSTTHPPLLAEPRTLPSTPNSKHTSTLAYAWFRPEDDSELLFVLTTSSDPNATVQALATMSLMARKR